MKKGRPWSPYPVLKRTYRGFGADRRRRGAAWNCAGTSLEWYGTAGSGSGADAILVDTGN